MNQEKKYAKFLITGCLKLQKEDKLFIIGSDFNIDFINILKEVALELGITEIETLINDNAALKELFLTKTYEEIIKSPLIDKTKYNEMAKRGYAFLMLSSPLPNYYDKVDAQLLSKVNNYQAQSIATYREYQAKNLIKWNICAVPNNYWAKDLNISLEELWNLIYQICLINEDDPIKAWNEKMTKLKTRAQYLNDLKIDYLHYTNSLGTNLLIGLPKDYIFRSADGKNIVNMPTEEVFTSPDRFSINGIVYSSKVLLVNNQLIKDFWLEFKDGRIINYDAKIGKDILTGIINTDEGSHYLGEVALVDYSSPISLTNVIFKNTLYDENSSCHLAIGESFPDCIKGGLELSTEELQKKGLNISQEHIDFFIGTKDLKIVAHLQNNTEKVIMEQGNFVEV